jgi:Fe-S oxidoreductase
LIWKFRKVLTLVQKGEFFMFRLDRCNYCGECLAHCQYLGFDQETGVKEITKLAASEKVDWLYDCVTCMACDEYCPTGARPFDLILQRLEEDGSYVPPVLLAEKTALFDTSREPRSTEPMDRVISACVMTGSMPWAIQGQLFENITVLKGLPYFCNLLFAHLGNESIMRERLPLMVENLAKSGAKEIVFIHEDCYAMLTNYAGEYGIELPFKPVHLFEYLRDYLRDNQDKLTKLNLKVAYQRPCASRHTPPEVENALNEIFAMIGIERVARQYDSINALCCGSGRTGQKLAPQWKNMEPFQEKNIRDAKDHGAEAMVYLCAMCFGALNELARAAGMKNYMVTDICRLALGEELPAEKPE